MYVDDIRLFLLAALLAALLAGFRFLLARKQSQSDHSNDTVGGDHLPT